MKRSENGSIEGLESGDICHYLHKDQDVIAALDLCHEDNVHGLVMTNDNSYEVLPLNPRLKRMLDLWKDNKNE